MKEEKTKTRLGKSKQGYGYKYTELAQINEYCEENHIRYYQYIDRIDQDDYIMTVIQVEGNKESEPRRGCRVVQATLQGIKNPAQEQGSALTYARRYSLLMALGLATEDDDGASLTKDKEPTKKAVTTTKEILATETQLKTIKEIYTNNIEELKGLLASLKKQKINQLTITEASNIIKANKGKVE